MRILIDIPEEVKKKIDENLNSCELDIYDCVMLAVKSGVPLPKWHGRLIDADAYIDEHGECGWLDDIAIDEFNTITPTIIEAQK